MRQDPNNYWEQLERLEKLIRAAEFKAGVIFSFHSLIIGLLFERMEEIRPVLAESMALMITCGVWLIFVLISVYHCFKCFRPQIEMKYDSNVLFFRDAVYAFGDVNDYADKIIDIFGKEEDFYRQLAEQIHAECKIIDQKFKSVHGAIKYFGVSCSLILLIGVISVAQMFF
ncbi:MAG: hypothetical protein HKN89_01300 [Eudoraea sp.]|nr:hypothetical protein [Eudoraea sp.]